MKITVVGSGYVGLVAAACFAELDHEVVSVDNDAAKTAVLQGGEMPIHEQYLPELLARYRGRSIRFTSSLPEAVRTSDAIFIAVGTPQAGDGYADLSYVESVARELARSISGYKLIVEKSTVPVFTHDWIRKIILLNGASPDAFDVASNPEFLREGTAVTDFLYPDRLVIGVDSERAGKLLRDIYAPLTSGAYYKNVDTIPAPDGARVPPPLVETSAKSAELIKHASNAFLAMKISFINAVANLCESVGADVRQVCAGIGADSRIGPRFLNPGVGYGGSCFPKDLMAFRAVARECGYDFRLLDEVININEDQRHRFFRKIRKALWTLRGKRLGVLGLSFKDGTDDIRESPAIAIVQMLLKEGAEICAYDPAAIERAREILPSSGITYAESAYGVAAGADALIILTDWADFAQLDLERIHAKLAYPIVVDGRNLYDPKVMAAHGFLYYSVGRPDVEPAAHSVGTVG
jgi:UDPglucose 6-dehydrogenase